MCVFSQSVTSNRLTRIPKRLQDDLKTLRLLQNWREALAAKLSGAAFKQARFRNGVMLSAPPEVDLLFLLQEVWIDEIYNPSDYRIEEENTIIDIGGNIGVFAIYAATAALRTKVLAFEPFPENAKCLRQNVADSNLENIEFYEKAVAGKANTRTMQVADNWVAHSLSNQANAPHGISVECITLEEVLAKIPQCDLLKIDCEGSEYEIFYSCAHETFKKIRRIVSEYHERPEENYNGEALRRFLEKQSFRIDHFVGIDDKSGIICATRI